MRRPQPEATSSSEIPIPDRSLARTVPFVTPDGARRNEAALEMLGRLGDGVAVEIATLDFELRGLILNAWIERDGAKSVLRALARSQRSVLADALARIAPGSIEWIDVAHFAARNVPAFDPLLLPHASDVTSAACRSFLVSLVSRVIDPESRAHAIAGKLPHALVRSALLTLDPWLDGPAMPDAALDVLLETAERILFRFDPERTDEAAHELIARVGRLRRRVGRHAPHGFLGALIPPRAPSKPTIVEHTGPDGASIVVLAVGGADEIHLRAPAHALRDIASALADEVMGRAIAELDADHPTVFLDPSAFSLALARTLPPHLALADDLVQLASLATTRGTPIRCQYVEGWWEPASIPPDRDTLVEPEKL